MSTNASHGGAKPDLQLLTDRGFALFPCKPQSKHPAILDWPDAATQEMAQIVAWANNFENCNWGIATGAKSGFFALDVDRKPTTNGEVAADGFVAIAAWSAEHPETPEWLRTASVHTSRGTHYLFSYPNDREIPNSAGLLAAGIDIRGWHGYVMAPGSIHPDGTVYEWANEESIVASPRWLLDKIAATRVRSVAASDQSAGNGNGETKISRGRRNATLTSLAGSMRRRGMVHAAIEAALLEVNCQQCEIPLPEAEVRIIARSVSRYEPDPSELKRLSLASSPSRHITGLQDIPDPRSLARDPVKFLVDDLIPMNAVSVIAAEYSVGKTWLGLILAAEAKRGGTFIGRDVIPCEHVLYLDRENPLSVIQERMDAVYREGEEAHRHWGMWCGEEPPLLENSLLLEFAHPGVVMIFDALIRFHRADENRPTEMAAVMGYLRHLQSRGATLIVFHHRDKKLEAGYRGTAEIPAGADVLFSLSKEEGDLLVLRAIKNRLQVDQCVTFKADWDEATLVPCELNSIIDKRALVAEIGDQIRRNPGISQSRTVKNINSTRVQRVSRWRVQRILDQHEGSLWRAERGPSGTRTGYYDLFSAEKKLLVEGGSETSGQQVVIGRPAEPAAGGPAALQTNKSITSKQPAGAADCCQQLLPAKPADVLPPHKGGSQQVGLAGNSGTGRPRDDGDGKGALA